MRITTENRNDRPTHLVWLDLEMTGLDTSTHHIVEVAVIITGFDLKELATYRTAVYQPEDVLALSNEFSQATHTASGLYDEVRSSSKSEVDVEREVVEFISSYIPVYPVILAGNSIGADRRFIDVFWPTLNEILHYRMLDVSSFKIMRMGLGQEQYVKKNTHRALDDIRESIAELRMYTK